MKKKFIISLIFVLGFLVGAITINLMTIPARQAYRETLQKLYIFNQYSKALIALREGDNFEAAVHLWNEIEAGLPNGSNLFNHELIHEMDQSLWFILYPQMNRIIDELVYMKPELQIKARGVRHGELAATLYLLGHKDIAKEHWAQSSNLLNISEEAAKKKFIELIENHRDVETEKDKLLNE
jgi:hypothetical protein